VATLATTLAFYAIVTCLGAVARRDEINPDGIAYIRNAIYLAEGRWRDSVSGYWSPLLSWGLAPLMYFGHDGLYALRAVLGVWGAVLVIGVWVFLGRCTAVAFPWNVVVLMLVVLAAADWATSMSTPDVLLGALLLWYFVFTATPDVLSSRRAQILAGAVGGLAYLAKAYAFPFFLAHYSLTVLLYFALRRQETRAGDALVAWATGLITFALIAGPWVGVLSSKYGRFTFSIVAAHAHNLVGPPEVEKRDDVLYRAQTVSPGRITVWETPENLSFKDWSPFASFALFKHQVKVMKRNCERVVRAIGDFDLFALVPGLLFLMLPIRLAACRRGTVEGAGPYPAAWSLMTIIVYAGGFLPIYFEARYIEPVLWPICCILVFGILSEFGHLLAHEEVRRSLTFEVPLLSALCALSFAGYRTGIAHSAIDTVVRTGMRPASLYHSPYRECGSKLAALGCGGPVAACRGSWHAGLYVSYHASLPFLGEIRGSSPAAVEESLEQSGARVFLAHAKWPLLEDFVSHTKWRRVVTIDDGGEDAISIFVAPETEVRSPNAATPAAVAGQKN
jgi:hypothetical protein